MINIQTIPTHFFQQSNTQHIGIDNTFVGASQVLSICQIKASKVIKLSCINK